MLSRGGVLPAFFGRARQAGHYGKWPGAVPFVRSANSLRGGKTISRSMRSSMRAECSTRHAGNGSSWERRFFLQPRRRHPEQDQASGEDYEEHWLAGDSNGCKTNPSWISLRWGKAIANQLIEPRP